MYIRWTHIAIGVILLIKYSHINPSTRLTFARPFDDQDCIPIERLRCSFLPPINMDMGMALYIAFYRVYSVSM